ncbi:FAD-dependent oxidoreductase [Cupriavidus sp. CP313]
MAASPRQAPWIGVAVAAILCIAAYWHFELGNVLTLDHLKESRDTLAAAYRDQPLPTLIAFFALYVAAAALSIPGAAILTLGAGAMFGLGPGMLVTSFASSLGALLAFLASRYLLRAPVQARFGQSLAAINEGIRKDGVLYLLTLRLVPVFPFWLINLLMGLAPINAGTFYLVSQAGMLAGTAVYVNAGTQLAAIQSMDDILSPKLLASFLLLGAFPMVAKACAAWRRRRTLYAKWKAPATYERNLVVIGAGAGGLVSAYIAAAVKAQVTLIEAHRMGGDCLNTGCVPSKALIRSAKLARQLKTAERFGFRNINVDVDFAAVMRRLQGVIHDIEPHDSMERYRALGVDVLHGHARIVDPWRVQVTLAGGTVRTITTRSIVIAAGASPVVPPIPGIDDTGYLTSDTVWGLTQLPRRLVVLGGGPIGCELAQSFARLGAQVTQLEVAPRILMREDPDVSALVDGALREDGINILTGHLPIRAEVVEGQKRLIARNTDGEVAVEFDQLLCAVGRTPRVTGYGLEELGIPLTDGNTIETNAYLQTLYPNIYAVGDVTGPFQFTHAAAHQAWYAAVNALFGRFRKFKADYSVIPWTTFTEPEVSRAGLSETEASKQGIAYEVTRYALDDLDRAIADGNAHGFVKVLTVPDKDRILGVTIVGAHAGDLLAEYVLAMKHGIGLNKILGTIHAYPTLAEANKHAAGAWKRAHAPQRLLAWVARYHAWERA